MSVHSNRVHSTKVRARRIDAERDLFVRLKTIGGLLDHRLRAVNVSRTGLLVSSLTHQNVPFQANTIVDMEIDTDGEIIGRTIKCLGKVVRVDSDSPDMRNFAVHIVQIEDGDEEHFAASIGNLVAKLELPAS